MSPRADSQVCGPGASTHPLDPAPDPTSHRHRKRQPPSRSSAGPRECPASAPGMLTAQRCSSPWKHGQPCLPDAGSTARASGAGLVLSAGHQARLTSGLDAELLLQCSPGTPQCQGAVWRHQVIHVCSPTWQLYKCPAQWLFLTPGRYLKPGIAANLLIKCFSVYTHFSLEGSPGGLSLASPMPAPHSCASGVVREVGRAEPHADTAK